MTSMIPSFSCSISSNRFFRASVCPSAVTFTDGTGFDDDDVGGIGFTEEANGVPAREAGFPLM